MYQFNSEIDKLLTNLNRRKPNTTGLFRGGGLPKGGGLSNSRGGGIPPLMPPTSWVDLALAGLAEARGHDGRGHRESLFSKLWRIFGHIFTELPEKKQFPRKNLIYDNKKKAPAVYALASFFLFLMKIMNSTPK